MRDKFADERRESVFTNICFRTREVKVSLSYLLVNALVNNYSILRLYRYVAEHKPRDPSQQLRANQGLNVHKERATNNFALHSSKIHTEIKMGGTVLLSIRNEGRHNMNREASVRTGAWFNTSDTCCTSHKFETGE